jgi:hypothetical protein
VVCCSIPSYVDVFISLFSAFGEGRELFSAVPERRYRGRGMIDRSIPSGLEDGSGCIDGILV